MDREPLLTGAVYDAPETNGGITLFPLVPYHMRFMEKHGINPDAPTSADSLSILYMLTHPWQELKKIETGALDDLVDDFSGELSFDQVKQISDHAEAKFKELEASQSKSAGQGKRKQAGHSRPSKP